MARIDVKLIAVKDKGIPRKNAEGIQYWRLRWTDPETGKRPYKAIGYLSPEDAETMREQVEAKLRLGMATTPSLHTAPVLNDIAVEYLRDLQVRATDSYLRAEVMRLGHMKRHLGRMRADRVTSATLRTYAGTRAKEVTRNGETTKRKSVSEEINTIRRALKVGFELGIIDKPPPSRPNLKFLPYDARPHRRLTEPEVHSLINAGTAYAPAIGLYLTLAAWSGRRPIALRHARRSHCERLLAPDLQRQDRLMFWERDKAGVGRGWGPLPQPAFEALLAAVELTQRQEGDPLLFTSATGKALTDFNFNRPWHKIVKAAGLANVKPYDLRKFAATRILNHVGNVKEAQTFTGHRTVQSLLRYVYPEREAAEQAAASIGWTPVLLRVVNEEQ